MYSYRELDDPRQVLPIARSAFALRYSEQGSVEEWLSSAIEHERKLYGVYDGDTLLSAFMLYDFDMRLRDSLVAMGGIGLLCSRLDARGKGAVRTMLIHALQTMKEQGHVVSVLDPFDESFYRNYGWEKFSRRQTIELRPGGLCVPESSGPDIVSADLPIPDEKSMAFYNDYASKHGTLAQRSQQQWASSMELRAWSPDVAARGVVRFSQSGDVLGLMEYELSRKVSEYSSTFTVNLLAAGNEEALHEMLRYLKRLSHQISTIRLNLPLNTELWPYFSDRPTKYSVSDEFMIRIVSMEALNGLSMEMPDLCVAIDVADPQASWNQGVWVLTIDSGVLRIERGGQADVRCGIGTLSSVISGFSTFSEMFRAKRAEALGTYRGQDFPKTSPYLADHF
jgi:predicted acetyltransferase